MLKIFALKEQQEKDAAAGIDAGARQTPGELRIQKDVGEMDYESSTVTSVNFPNPDDLMNFEVEIKPEEGYWANGTFKFTFAVPPMYPHTPPKVHCETKIYHPNIDLEGNVCLNLLRDDWKPILSCSNLIDGLLFLFLEPNPDDPLNKSAAEMMKSNEPNFQRNVRQSMAGGYVDGTRFPQPGR